MYKTIAALTCSTNNGALMNVINGVAITIRTSYSDGLNRSDLPLLL